jgi:hypothetical protein
MAKIGSLPWHREKVRELEERQSKNGKAAAQARIDKHHSYKEGYGNTLKITTKDPLPRYRSRIEYDFLKYIRVVFKWVADNHPELNKPEVEFLLYLYGIGAFSRKQFDDYHKLLGLYSVKTLIKFEDEGWIRIWRAKSGKLHTLYTLTQKAKIMCNKMHRYCAGVEEIPLNPVSNEMARKDAPRINTYYLDMIKRMNKDKAPTEE